MKKIDLRFAFFSLIHPVKTNTITCKKTRGLFPVFILALIINLLCPGISYGQAIIGSFPTIDGGFEAQPSSGNPAAVAVPMGATGYVNYTVPSSNAAVVTYKSTGGRSGPQYIEATAGSSNYSFNTPTAVIGKNIEYAVQYYYKYPPSSPNRSFKISATPNKGTNFGTAVTSGDVNSISTWTKRTEIITSANNTATFGFIKFAASGGSFASPYYIDDIVVYPTSSPGLADIIAPNDVTAPSATFVDLTHLFLSWTAAAGGVDGGGYVVVRYTTDPTVEPAPNANGVYAVGNSIGNGKVAYIGTGTSFTDGNVAAIPLTGNTFYYYRVYTVDKAFNYSASPLVFGGLTTAAVAPVVSLTMPGVIAASIEQGSVTDIIYTFTLTSTAQFTTLTQLTFPNTSATYNNTDFTNFKLYASSTNTFPGGTPLATITSPAAASPQTFSGFWKLIPPAATYFWITADVKFTATLLNSIKVTPDLAGGVGGNFTFLSATTVNIASATPSGQQTIIAPAQYLWDGSALDNKWTTAANWTPDRITAKATDQLTFNGATVTVNSVPATETISELDIIGSSNVTLTSAASSTLTILNISGLGNSDLIISAGSALTLGSTVNLSLGTGTTADVSGVLNISSGTTYNTDASNAITTVTNPTYPFEVDGIIKNTGTLTSTNAARLVIKNGAVYNHSQDGGTVPKATWNFNSACLISGIKDQQSINGHNQTFSKFVWDGSLQNKTHFILGQNVSNASPCVITDSFIVRRTNGKILQITYTSGQNDFTCNNYFQYGGIVAVTYNTDDGGIQRSLTVNNTFYVTDSLVSDARFQIINNPGGTNNIKGRLYVKGNIEMHPTLLSSTIEATKGVANPSVAELYFTGSAAQFAKFSTMAGNIDFVNNHTGSGVTLGSNATANNFDQRQGVFYINGNTLTIKAAVSYTGAAAVKGTFGGSSTSNLILQGAAGTLNFYTGYQVLKDFIQEASSSATLGTELSITASPAPGRDSLGLDAVLTTNDNLILRSDAIGTARVAPIQVVSGIARATINGKVTVERYLPMGTTYDSRRWRLLTVPFTTNNAPTINAGWQEGVSNAVRTTPWLTDPKPGYGTHITVSTTAANGFDQGVKNNPSIYYYNAGTWVAPLNTTTTKLTDNKGVYLLFARGDRSIIIVDQFVSAKPTTLDPRGELNLGTVSIPLVAAGAMQPIGNPYASAIKLDNVTFSDTLGNITPGKSKWIYLWDPRTNGSSTTVGKFITCHGDGNTPASYTYSGNTSNYESAPGVIESSGAFMIWGTAAGGNVVFHETDKITTSTTIGIASRPAPTPEKTNGSFGKIGKLYTDLEVIKNGEPILADGVVSVFNKHYSSSIDDMDALKPFSFATNELLYIVRNEQRLAIERRKKINTTDTIFMNLYKPLINDYQFSFRPNDFDTRYLAFLKDNFTGKLTPVDMQKKSTYRFSITSDPVSYTPGRFYIIFRRNIPAKPITAETAEQENDIAVQWDNPDDEYEAPYFIERSLDGEHFTTAAMWTTEMDSPESKFTWLDEKPAPGTYLYRIRYTNEEGETMYSNVTKVVKRAFKGIPFVYPNPVRNGQIGLQMGLLPQAVYAIKLINAQGQLVHTEMIKHLGNTETKIIKVKNTIAKGIYKLEIINANKTAATINILIQ